MQSSRLSFFSAATNQDGGFVGLAVVSRIGNTCNGTTFPPVGMSQTSIYRAVEITNTLLRNTLHGLTSNDAGQDLRQPELLPPRTRVGLASGVDVDVTPRHGRNLPAVLRVHRAHEALGGIDLRLRVILVAALHAFGVDGLDDLLRLH